MSNEGTAYNRAYLASAIAFPKIHLGETSDTLETLGESGNHTCVRCEIYVQV